MDRARGLSAARGIDEHHAMRPLHQVDEVNPRHFRFDHLDTVTDFLPDPASRQESDCVISSHAVTKTDDPNSA